MLVKLLKKAEWNGGSHRSGTIHEVSNQVGNKLISREYAKLHENNEPEKVLIKDDD